MAQWPQVLEKICGPHQVDASLYCLEMTPHQQTGKIFIGHGRSRAWLELNNFLTHRLQLDWTEFNRASAAGLATKERLEVMLAEASFAFLVMTAEDEQLDGTTRAREDVVHEAGLFQGKLGFNRAIICWRRAVLSFQHRWTDPNSLSQGQDQSRFRGNPAGT